MVGTFLNSTILQVHSYSVIHQDIIGCITNLDKINATKCSIKCKLASISFWVKVLKGNRVNVCVFLKDKGGERPCDIYSSNFSAQVVLKLERSMMGHFVILIENIIQLIVIIVTTILLLSIRDNLCTCSNLEVIQSLMRCHSGCVGIPLQREGSYVSSPN